jgi:hypothetical protein
MYKDHVQVLDASVFFTQFIIGKNISPYLGISACIFQGLLR